MKYSAMLTYGFEPGSKMETLEVTLSKGFESQAAGELLLAPALLEALLEQIQNLSEIYPARKEKVRDMLMIDIIKRIAKDYPEQLVAVAENRTEDE